MHPNNNPSWAKLPIFLFGIALAILLLNLTGGMAEKTPPKPGGKDPPNPMKGTTMKPKNGNGTASTGKPVPPATECNPAAAAAACDTKIVPEKLMDQCKKSVVVQQTCKVPKHLRPPWHDRKIQEKAKAEAKDKGIDIEKGAWYACNDTKGEEYCACAYDLQAPKEEFGMKLFAKPNLNGECLDDFYKVAMMPMCGNEWYDHVKHCAFVQFYDNKPDQKPEGELEKRTLVLLDGCIVSDKPCKAKFKVEFTEPDGSFFTKCSEETKTVYEDKDKAETNVAAHEKPGPGVSTFTLPMQFVHRRCKSLFSDDAIETYKGIKLIVSGECGQKTFDLPDLDGDKGRVQEMRGLQVSLKEGLSQWRAKTPDHYDYMKEDKLKWSPTAFNQINTQTGKPYDKDAYP